MFINYNLKASRSRTCQKNLKIVMRRLINILVILNLCVSLNAESTHPILIVISYDAFGYDYFEKFEVPNMVKFRNEGTSAAYIKNVFPTKTYPNHFTIATGLFSESHGVTGNSFYNRAKKKGVKYSYEMFHTRDDVIPIWITNQNASDTRHSGVMMWPGCDYKYGGIEPTFMQTWSDKEPIRSRVDTVITWLTHPKTPANFIMMYVEEPDSHGHALGITNKMNSVLRELDEVTQYLDDELIRIGIHHRANIIHLSDHGMVNVMKRNVLNITQYLEPDTFKYYETSPSLIVVPQEGQFDNVYNRLSVAEKELKHFQLFKTEDIPERWHFKNSPTSPPIYVLADLGYAFDDLYTVIQHSVDKYQFQVTKVSEFGIHGYDNNILSMHAMFFGRGPIFKKQHVVQPFDNYNLYSLFCHILQVEPQPNNGSLTNVLDLLQVPPSSTCRFSDCMTIAPKTVIKTFTEVPDSHKATSILVGAAILSVAFLGCVSFTILCMLRYKKRTEDISLSKRRYADVTGIPIGECPVAESQQLLISDSDESEKS